MTGPALRQALLTMLAEAPGFPVDMAASLAVPEPVIARELSLLADTGAAVAVPAPHGPWYRLPAGGLPLLPTPTD